MFFREGLAGSRGRNNQEDTSDEKKSMGRGIAGIARRGHGARKLRLDGEHSCGGGRGRFRAGAGGGDGRARRFRQQQDDTGHRASEGHGHRQLRDHGRRARRGAFRLDAGHRTELRHRGHQARPVDHLRPRAEQEGRGRDQRPHRHVPDGGHPAGQHRAREQRGHRLCRLHGDLESGAGAQSGPGDLREAARREVQAGRQVPVRDLSGRQRPLA